MDCVRILHSIPFPWGRRIRASPQLRRSAVRRWMGPEVEACPWRNSSWPCSQNCGIDQWKPSSGLKFPVQPAFGQVGLGGLGQADVLNHFWSLINYGLKISMMMALLLTARRHLDEVHMEWPYEPMGRVKLNSPFVTKTMGWMDPKSK